MTDLVVDTLNEHGGNIGSGGTKGSGSGNDAASTTKSYHNGGVEGEGFADWYDANLAGSFPADSAAASEATVLDLSNAGSAFVINLTTNPDGTQSGTVEFTDVDGNPVVWGHFESVDEIILPDDPNSFSYTIDDFSVIGQHGDGLPPKISLEQYIGTGPVDDVTKGTGSGGTKGTGSGGTKGTGSGGTKGTGSGGTKGTGSGGTKGTGSGGTKGTGSGGTKGTGSGGTKGSGSGGTKGTGSGGTSGSALDIAADAGLSTFSAFPEDDEIKLEDVTSLMTQKVDEDDKDNGWDHDDDDDAEMII